MKPKPNPAEVAISLVVEHFGFVPVVRQLDGERDWNFLVENQRLHQRCVLKLFAAGENPGFVAAEIAAQQRLAADGLPVPSGVPTLAGEWSFACEVDGVGRIGRMVSFLPGTVLAKQKVVQPEFWDDFGSVIGKMCASLNGFDHPAIHREFDWDVGRGEGVVQQLLPLVADAPLQGLLQAVGEQHAVAFAALSLPLRQGVVHGDLNDWNVFLVPTDPSQSTQQQVAGIIDFGDMVWSDLINDLAIAIAYAVLDRADPLDVACRMVAACHGEWPMTDDELQLLWHRVRLRLAVSVAMAAKQVADDPANVYLRISQAAIRRTLPRLMLIPAGFAYAAFCRACERPLPDSVNHAKQWLESRQGKFHSPVGGLTEGSVIRIDWSVGSSLFAGDPALLPRLLEDATEQLLENTPGFLGVGGWGEPRLVYQSEQFGTESGHHEPRTVHLGVDVFAPAGTEVIAPLDGTIHAVDNIALPLDYGGVVVTRHDGGLGTPVFVLYGHLDPDSIRRLKPGQRIAGGETLGRLGDRTCNGGWIPHLHLQVLADDFGTATGFPGVCQASWQSLWLEFCPNPAALLGLTPEFVANRTTATEVLLVQRKKVIGPSVRTSYTQPVQMVRGWMQYLFDEAGQKYLDGYNNVPHVGHCHPKVVEATLRQMKLLNSNTRYVSRLQGEFAERLAGTMPEGLDVCFFLNSASEANELALRLARAATGGRDMIVNEDAYHGHTTSLIDLSPYKHNGRGGEGPPDWVHTVPVPDTYRGPYRNDDTAAGQKFASHILTALQSIATRGGRLAGFIAETCPSVGGQIIPPAAYLASVYQLVRAAGGVCIADEVQTGYGRMGDCFYAFERSQVVPDIVVLGKPVGNGHPLAIVVTTGAIADAFDNGMEYFSTFGGNHVSCAAGLAVLEVVQSENLQQHARVTGEHLGLLFHRQIATHPMVGDIRGSGLFWGIELVADRTTREPATSAAGWVKNQLRHRGILIGTDGPHDNVLKIRPPMPFDSSNAEHLTRELSEVLMSVGLQRDA